jgi:hypothetical protein
MLPDKFTITVDISDVWAALDDLTQSKRIPLLSYVCPIARVARQVLNLPVMMGSQGLIVRLDDGGAECFYLPDSYDILHDFDPILSGIRNEIYTVEQGKQRLASNGEWPRTVHFTKA